MKTPMRLRSSWCFWEWGEINPASTNKPWDNPEEDDGEDDIKFNVCTFSEIWEKLDKKVSANKSGNDTQE